MPVRVPDRVEDVELRLRAEVRGVGDAAGGEVGLGLLRHVARVAAVGLARDRVVDEEVDVQRLVRAERVEEGAAGVGQQQHVRLVDRLEPADRGAVEAQAVGERVLAERRRRDGEVLHDAGQVAEAHVDVLDVVVADVRGDLVGTVEHRSSGIGRTANRKHSGELPLGVPSVSSGNTATRRVAGEQPARLAERRRAGPYAGGHGQGRIATLSGARPRRLSGVTRRRPGVPRELPDAGRAPS